MNDRPYAALSFVSVALAKLFGTAITGRSAERQELADTAIPLRRGAEMQQLNGRLAGVNLVRLP